MAKRRSSDEECSQRPAKGLDDLFGEFASTPYHYTINIIS